MEPCLSEVATLKPHFTPQKPNSLECVTVSPVHYQQLELYVHTARVGAATATCAAAESACLIDRAAPCAVRLARVGTSPVIPRTASVRHGGQAGQPQQRGSSLRSGLRCAAEASTQGVAPPELPAKKDLR